MLKAARAPTQNGTHPVPQDRMFEGVLIPRRPGRGMKAQPPTRGFEAHCIADKTQRHPVRLRHTDSSGAPLVFKVQHERLKKQDRGGRGFAG